MSEFPGYLTEQIVAVAEQAFANHRDEVLPWLKDKRMWAPSQAAYEACTLQLRYRRRAGHTTAALTLLERYPDAVMIEPLAVSEDSHLFDTIRERLPHHPGVTMERVLPARAVLDHRHDQLLKDCTLVIIDNASQLQRDRYNYDRLTDFLACFSPDIFYLLLG